MNEKEIIELSNKCLNCKNPLCRKGCPINTNIPGFIEEVKNNNFKQAYNILQQNNIMSEICSNVCFYEECCEGHCIRGIKQESVKISTLEKQVNLWANKNQIEYKQIIEKKNGKKVAIIGGGPAGISARCRTCKKRI